MRRPDPHDIRRARNLRGLAFGSACDKVRYTTGAAAEAAAALKAEGDPRYPPQLRAYRCPNCHGWHLTSQPRRSAQ